MDDGKQFVSYEYTQISADQGDLHLLLDCYESLGWERDNRLEQESGHLTLRRSRRLVNHTELTRLQRHLEACLAQMEYLEKHKGAKATSAALAAGVAGAVLMAISVFAVTAQPPQVMLCALFGCPALGLWAWAPVLYKTLYGKHSETASELIGKKWEEIFEVCEKGSKLL